MGGAPFRLGVGGWAAARRDVVTSRARESLTILGRARGAAAGRAGPGAA